MPPPRLGLKPYDEAASHAFDPADPCGWPVTEYEESLELQPGLQHVAEQLLGVLQHLGRGDPAHGIVARSCMAIPFGRNTCMSAARLRTNAM